MTDNVLEFHNIFKTFGVSKTRIDSLKNINKLQLGQLYALYLTKKPFPIIFVKCNFTKKSFL